MSRPSQEELMQDGAEFNPQEEIEVKGNIAATYLTRDGYDHVFTGMERKVVHIFNQEGPGGDKPVFVAVNGRGFSIPRMKDVKLPVAVVSALENAVEDRYYRAQDEQGRDYGPILKTSIRRFNFSVK